MATMAKGRGTARSARAGEQTNGGEQLLTRALPFLERLAAEDVAALGRLATRRGAARGARLFHQGQRGDALFVVAHGSVHVVLTNVNGDEATIAVLGPGDALGELSLLDGLPRSASAVVAERSELLVIQRGDFVAWLGARPQAALALLRLLCARLRATDEALAEMALSPLYVRLARRLLELAAADDAVHATQSELATMVGATREAVNKTLRTYVDAGLVQVGRGTVALLDRRGLRALQG
jgi:CRP-like cAMP-binding protein